jgi:hypothetical protein
MATRTGARSTGKAAGSGGRTRRGPSGRGGRGRGKPAPSGPMGLLQRVTSTLGRTGGRGASAGGGIASKATGFVRGFLSGGGRGKRRR